MKNKLKHKKSKKSILLYQKPTNNTALLIVACLVLFTSIINASIWLRNIIAQKEYETLITEINRWEQIVSQSPTYRDGYLKLAVLYWKIRDDHKAQNAVTKAIEIDPNYEETKNLKQKLGY